MERECGEVRGVAQSVSLIGELLASSAGSSELR